MNKKVLISVFFIIILILGVSGVLGYNNGLKSVSNGQGETKIIQIKSGIGNRGIIDLLKSEQLIRSKLAVKIYMKLNNINGLQAGKYELNSNLSAKEILNKMRLGEVYNQEVKITFKEGKNLRWIAKTISEKTNNTEEDVFTLLKDTNYINSLINKYWFLTNDIQNENIYYPLEGYLYPDTYVFENKDVSVKKIFNIILNKTDKVLSKYKSEIESNERSIHEILTIASIIELEGNDVTARKGIASVIYNRLKARMSLGSDVTTYYAMQVDMGDRNLYSSEIKTSNPYNTRGPGMSGKIPVGPISNPSEEAILAALNPSETNYLYFVADTTGKVYFTDTYAEHKNLIQRLQQQGLWYEYNKTNE